jgi:undecaprenyl-diphosphatase UppP
MFPRFWAKILAFLLLSHLFQVWSWPKVETGASPREASPPKGEYMTLGQALILGVVEGITEFLPISSTGHLLLAQRVMGVAPRGSEGASSPSKKEASDAYAISIQGGAIIAVLLLYRRRIWSMALGALGRDPAGFQLAIRLCAAFLPAALLGLLLERTIKHYLFGPWPIVVAWFGGGLGIFLVSRIVPKRGRPMEELQLKAALLIGLFQCLAMWPGVSRSLATIVGGLLCGLSMKAAVEFSFLLGLVTPRCSEPLRPGQALVSDGGVPGASSHGNGLSLFDDLGRCGCEMDGGIPGEAWSGDFRLLQDRDSLSNGFPPVGRDPVRL